MKRAILLAVLLALPTVSNAGFFSDYDDSKLENFRNQIERFQQAPLESKRGYLELAAMTNAEIQRNCSGISRSATYYLDQCYSAYSFTSAALAESYIYYAKQLISAGKRDDAKSVLKNIIIGFTENRFKSHVKEAEFLLADLEKPQESLEMEKVKLELEKTRLELERLRSKKD